MELRQEEELFLKLAKRPLNVLYIGSAGSRDFLIAQLLFRFKLVKLAKDFIDDMEEWEQVWRIVLLLSRLTCEATVKITNCRSQENFIQLQNLYRGGTEVHNLLCMTVTARNFWI